MKKLRWDSIVFLLLISLLGLANLFNLNKPTVSKLENRALKQKPVLTLDRLLSGDYFKSYEEYYSDTFILRDNFVKTSKDFQKAMAFMGPGITIVQSADDIQRPQENDVPENPESKENDGNIILPGEPTSPTPGTDENLGGKDDTSGGDEKEKEPPKTDFGDDPNVGYYLVVDGKAVQIFKFNKENFEYYAQILNKYREKLGSSVKIYSMIPPTAGEFLRLKKYSGITDSQNDALAFLESKLDDGITTVNVYDALNRHKDEYIYYRTDHHWTSLGAYYGYAEFMKTRGEEALSLSQFEELDPGDYLGSTYSKTLDKSLEKNPDKFIVYKPVTPHEFFEYDNKGEHKSELIDMQYADSITDKYLTFISSGGSTYSRIKTRLNNGKKLLIIKDSFGNALAPFMTSHYEEVFIVDPRFYNKKIAGKDIIGLIEDNGIDEVVFCIYMEDVNWQKFMSGVESLID